MNARISKVLFPFIVVCVFTLQASSAFAADNVGGVPANPRKDNPRSSSIFVHEINGGETVTDAVLLNNGTDVEKTIDVYATDSQNSSGGAFACAQKADEIKDAGGWIKLDQISVTLAPNTTQKVNFTIAAPETASLGEHNACIAMQVREPAKESGTNGVTLSFRSAIRVAITIKGGTKKALEIKSIEVTTKITKLFAKALLKNTGNVSLDVDVDVKLKSLYGRTIETKGGEYPVLAGQEAEFNFEYNRPTWGGIYVVEAQAKYNSDLDASLGDKGKSVKQVHKSAMVIVAPHPAVSALYASTLLLAGAPTYMLRRKRRFIKRAQKSGTPYVVQSGDTVTELAEKHGVSWKDIAKVNKLKKPYAVMPGQEIVLPESKPAKKA